MSKISDVLPGGNGNPWKDIPDDGEPVLPPVTRKESYQPDARAFPQADMGKQWDMNAISEAAHVCGRLEGLIRRAGLLSDDVLVKIRDLENYLVTALEECS